jgi:hypothetical protein
MRYREVASAVAETEEPKHEESRFSTCCRCSPPSLSSHSSRSSRLSLTRPRSVKRSFRVQTGRAGKVQETGSEMDLLSW